MFPTITRSPRRNSRRSSTGRITRSASAAWSDARSWGRGFFHWYNEQHHHTGLGLLTPAACTPDGPKPCANNARWFCSRPTRPIPNGLCSGAPQPAKLPGGGLDQSTAESGASCQHDAGRTTSHARRVTVRTTQRRHQLLRRQPMCGTLTVSGPEDRATLRSDPSAVPADGVAGQGGYQVIPAHTDPLLRSYTVVKAINRCVSCGESRPSRRQLALPAARRRQQRKPVH